MNYLLLILSVLAGAILVVFTKPNKVIVRLLLAFSGAYLLSVTILHLVPEVYKLNSNSTKTGILILLGIILQSILESFSKGAEHGHIHVHTTTNTFPKLLFISLCFHAFSEGLPIHNANENLLWAIVVHKIPITIVLTTFLLHAKYTKKTMLFFMTTFAFMSPLGMLLGDKMAFFTTYFSEITALIIGVFLHISTVILFETTENHKFNFQKFLAIILGILLTIFTL